MKTRTPRKSRKAQDTVRGRVRAHDPFELIRWLALSQPDPRKALAELVQNSLDAGAHTIRVTRVRERGAPSLRIWDDGLGVIPELDRRAALHYLATHIGHSRKRSLSPQERLQLMTQGQYGIGLLGFWSLGQQLEMRTAVQTHAPHRLVLHRDRPDFLIEPLRGRLAIEDRWTEVVVGGLHREAQGVLLGRRAADGAGDAAAANGNAAVEAGITARPSVARPRDLLPAGPLAAVRIVPDPVRVVVGGQRRIAARALDATGRAVEDPVQYDWTFSGPIGDLVSDVAHGPSTTLVAGPWTAEGRVEVVATSEGQTVQAEAAVEVIEEAGSARGAEGIPEPELIDQPGAPWRSRVVDERWQVNTAHRDYRSVADRAALKLRYLALLFAKELVLRNSQDPRLDSPLEQMVEAFTYADRRLARR